MGRFGCRTRCREHHTAVHEGGWAIQAVRPGQFRFIDPNGCPSLTPADLTTDLVTNLINHHHDHGGEASRAGPSRAGPPPRSAVNAADRQVDDSHASHNESRSDAA